MIQIMDFESTVELISPIKDKGKTSPYFLSKVNIYDREFNALIKQNILRDITYIISNELKYIFGLERNRNMVIILNRMISKSNKREPWRINNLKLVKRKTYYTVTEIDNENIEIIDIDNRYNICNLVAYRSYIGLNTKKGDIIKVGNKYISINEKISNTNGIIKNKCNPKVEELFYLDKYDILREIVDEDKIDKIFYMLEVNDNIILLRELKNKLLNGLM